MTGRPARAGMGDGMSRLRRTSVDTAPRRQRQGMRGSRPLSVLAAAAGATYAFWLVVSASLAPLDLLLGLAISMVLGAWAVRVLWAGDAPAVAPREVLAMPWFLLGLGHQVLAAAAHLARVVIDPRLPIQPVLIRHRTSLRRPISRVAFAQSVTLTPGTLTVDIEGDTFLIHCLGPEFARRIESGELERRVAAVFEPEAGE
jgi:multicomponent Na+:H+ antiporter subunit E